MSSDKKIGRAVNTFCCAISIIIFFIKIGITEKLTPDQIYGIRIFLVFIAILLIFGSRTKDIWPLVIDISVAVIYGSLCIVSVYVNESNSLLFMLLLLATGTLTLMFDKILLQIFMVLSEAIALLLWILPPGIMNNAYSLPDYLIGMFCLGVGDIILINIQRMLLEREASKREEYKTLDELLRVVDAKREDALIATKSKSEFLASMSHEIRTPINAVLGLNEMILRESTDKATIEYAQDIRSAGNSLLSLVNDILDFSKIEAGKMEIQPVVYDLGGMINDLINMITVRAMNKGLDFRLDIDSSLPHVLYGDEVRIKQSITNILTNAVKYTNEGYVTLTVKYRKVDEFQVDITVSISDTGIGMKKEDIDKLFIPFERLEEMKNRHVEGTGLGMTLTRNILHMMGSELIVDSVYEKGTTISFTVRQEVENWECIGSLDEAIKRVRQDDHSSEEYLIAPQARVLVVDDMPLNIKVFSSLLKRSKINIDSAESGMEALALVRKNKYDVIFLDHMMPEMDGIETLRRMQSDRFNINRYETPVIALTANAVSGAREKYIDAGFENYLTKPINARLLEDMLAKYLDPKSVLSSSEDVTEEQSDDEFVMAMRKVAGINVDDGIAASGSEEIYSNVIHEYCITIDTYADLIEKYFNEQDIRNYTIQVHALKSSSRLAGANELSELARRMEDCGNKEDLTTIQAMTGKLLDMYRGLKNPLSEALNIGQEETAPAQMIETQMLTEALMAMKEGISCFDMDLVESVMDQLSEYSFPNDFVPIYEQLKIFIAQVAFEDMNSAIDEYLDK